MMGMGGGASGAADILRLVFTGSRSPGASLPVLAGLLEDPRQARPERTRQLTLSMPGMSFLIDGRSFDPH